MSVQAQAFLRVGKRKEATEASDAGLRDHMKPSLVTAPTKLSIFALYRSLLRQTRLLPHEYLRYILAISHLSALTYDLCIFFRQFFRFKLSADINSALDESRKCRQRRATFNRLRKVAVLIQASTLANSSTGTLKVETC